MNTDYLYQDKENTVIILTYQTNGSNPNDWSFGGAFQSVESAKMRVAEEYNVIWSLGFRLSSGSPVLTATDIDGIFTVRFRIFRASVK